MPDTGQLHTAIDASGTLVLQLSGNWRSTEGVPSGDAVEQALARSPEAQGVAYDARQLGEWDSGVLTFLRRVGQIAEARGLPQDRSGLPEGVQRLINLAEAVPEKKDARRADEREPFLARIGMLTMGVGASLESTLAFVGESTLVLGRGARGGASYRKADLALLLRQSGIDALPIVTLVNFLLGLILAFVGAVQLRQFGAEIYVANLVGIAMVRDMAALMTGIIMAGRSGAAFAAEIGSMNSNQELDALQTTGISPMEFLVLPRVWALTAMMPLLALYANAVGILGGAAVGLGMLDLSATAYFLQTQQAVSLNHLFAGLVKALVYGALVALAGCLRGIQSGRSALAVGSAATSAVVTGIVWIIVACGLFQYISYVLGI